MLKNCYKRISCLFHHNRIKIALSLIICCVLIFIGVFLFKSSNKTPTPTLKLVEVEKVQKSHLEQTIRVFGTIHPKHMAILVAKGTGLLDVLIPTGQKISKGTLLAKIVNPNLENNLELSQSSEVLAKDQFDRFKPLLKTGYISGKEIVEKKQALIDAQKELAKTKIDLDSLRFYAPFDGIIGAYKKREGAEVNQGEAVVSVYDPASLVVDFDIPCSNIDNLQVGQEVSIFGKPYTVTHLQKMLDEDSHMCPADVNIQCENCLIGTTVEVDLVVAKRQNVIVVPFKAIFFRNSKPFVYIVENNKVAMIPVTTGLQQKESIEITNGLNPGQQLIIKGQERLYPQMSVAIYHPSHNKIL